ncbi:MAG: hydrogen gas-evolving membrane-bound hydrogenase subunit E [Bacillota bacterium]
MTGRNLAALLTLAVVTFIMVLVVAEMPEFGSLDKPQDNELYQRVAYRVVEDTGAVNAIAGIILDYRAYDTLGEATVLLVAIMATLAALSAGSGRHDAGGPPHG